MKEFKIMFPSGYQVKDLLDDNIDVNVALSSGLVLFATLFTIRNIQSLMVKGNDIYFWADSMLIVKDLEKVTIAEAVGRIISEGYGTTIFSEIGSIESVFGEQASYDALLDQS